MSERIRSSHHHQTTFLRRTPLYKAQKWSEDDDNYAKEMHSKYTVTHTSKAYYCKIYVIQLCHVILFSQKTYYVIISTCFIGQKEEC
jgi:hypothetical protein